MPYYIVNDDDRTDVRDGPFTDRSDADKAASDGERVIATSDWLEVDDE